AMGGNVGLLDGSVSWKKSATCKSIAARNNGMTWAAGLCGQGIGKLLNLCRVQPQQNPIIQLSCPEFLIELQRFFIPVQRDPFHARTILSCPNSGNLLNQSLAQTTLPKLRPNIQIIQPKARAAREAAKREII